MNRSVVEPVTPLYKHFPSDRSEFGFSSEPTSPQHSKDPSLPTSSSSFVKKHKRHKSNTPTHRAARASGLGRNTYPSAKHFNVTTTTNNNNNDDDEDGGFVNGEPEVFFRAPQCDQDGRQIFVKVSQWPIQYKNDHRKIHPKSSADQNEDPQMIHQFVLEKVYINPSKTDQLEVTDVQGHSNLMDVQEMQNEPSLKDGDGDVKCQENKIHVKSSDCDIERGENFLTAGEPGGNDPERDKPATECVLRERNARSIGVQVSPSPRYRLRFLPICGCGSDENEWEFCQCCFILQLIGRWAFSQCGLAILLFVWALLGAAAFHSTERPHELQQAKDLHHAQQELVVILAEEMHRIALAGEVMTASNPSLPPELVRIKPIEKAFAMHEQKMLKAVSAGYGEGGGADGSIWSYAGCLLFCVSLLTTLGFGAPVPRTTLGRLTAVVFSAVGIPLHLLLVFNIGMLVAVKLQNFARNWQKGTSFVEAFSLCCCSNYPNSQAQAAVFQQESPGLTRHLSTDSHFSPPRWLKLFPAVGIVTYYLFGFLVFGVGRSRPFSDCILFPLDFTAAGGVGMTSSVIRTSYAIYLEGAVILAAISVSILQVSASKGLTNLGLKLGLLTNS